jgi:hypothetical protein
MAEPNGANETNTPDDELIQFEPEPIPSCHDSPSENLQEGLSLDEYQTRHYSHKIKSLEQELKANKQLHKLRMAHSTRLFWLSISWIAIVWIVVLLAGFGQFPLSTPNAIPFRLSDTVMVAFITSTTATVLGLYGIAAYWILATKARNNKIRIASQRPPVHSFHKMASITSRSFTHLWQPLLRRVD